MSIYHIRYVMVKDLSQATIISSNPLYFQKKEMVDKWNKYLMLAPANDSKDTQKNVKNCGLK